MPIPLNNGNGVGIVCDRCGFVTLLCLCVRLKKKGLREKERERGKSEIDFFYLPLSNKGR